METSPPTAGRVMAGWFAAAVAGVVVAVLAQSNAVPADCEGWCFSDRFGAAFVAVVIGLPSLIVGAVIGVIVLGMLARRGRTGFGAGCVAGIGGLVAGPLLVVAALYLHFVFRRT